MKRTWMIVACVLLAATGVMAQENTDEEMLIEAGVIWAVPNNGLTDYFEQEPIGVNVMFAGRAPGLPLYLGLDFSAMNHGASEELKLFDIDDVPVQVMNRSVRQNIYMTHLFARWQLEVGPVQPHIDFLGGLKFFTTRNSVDSDVIVFENGLQATAITSDRALSYGVGAGLNVPLYTGEFGVDRRTGTASLNLSARYLFGTDADVVTQTSFDQQEGLFRVETVRSSTDLLIPQVAVRVDL